MQLLIDYTRFDIASLLPHARQNDYKSTSVVPALQCWKQQKGCGDLNVFKTFLLANCNPNDFGNPPKPPLAEATLRNNQEASLLVAWKANVNIAARGEFLSQHIFAPRRRLGEPRPSLAGLAQSGMKDMENTKAFNN